MKAEIGPLRSDGYDLQYMQNGIRTDVFCLEEIRELFDLGGDTYGRNWYVVISTRRPRHNQWAKGLLMDEPDECILISEEKSYYLRQYAAILLDELGVKENRTYYFWLEEEVPE